jgi:hypothetical protein
MHPKYLENKLIRGDVKVSPFLFGRLKYFIYLYKELKKIILW